MDSYYSLDMYISSFLDPIVILGSIIRALRWIYFLNGLGKKPHGTNGGLTSSIVSSLPPGLHSVVLPLMT